MDPKPWTQPIGELEQRLGTRSDRGLSPEQAVQRRARDGENVLIERARTSALTRFLSQFTDVTVLALIAAAAVATAMGWFERADQSLLERFGDAGAIGFIVVMNAIIGFVQESKAESALSALRTLSSPVAQVVREGRVNRIDAKELVLGDVVSLVEGDRIPADIRLTQSTDLMVSEAPLTGESEPVVKDSVRPLADATPLAERNNSAYMGTHVTRGKGHGIVVATGMRTELGHIVEMLSGVESPQTPLQISLRRFGFYVVLGCIAVGALVFLVGVWRLHAPYSFLLLTGVSLAVAAIPEGLPAITTIVLALGVQRMAKRNVLVRRLSAVETLGSADVICTDKTGTLTENRMVARRLKAAGRVVRIEESEDAQGPNRLTLEGRELKALDPAAAELIRASRFAPAAEDPTDRALRGLYEAFEPLLAEPGQATVLRVLAFDGDRRMATVITGSAKDLHGYTHGAPENVLSRCNTQLDREGRVVPLRDRDRDRLVEHVNDWARDGLRVLALARARTSPLEDLEQATREELIERFEKELTLIGFVGLADPPRSGVDKALQMAAHAGVSTLMITGDHPETARAIGKEIGLLEPDSQVVTGAEVDAMSDEELSRRIDHIRVVARATAANKLRLVEVFEQKGHIVAMTGDGVNDAPAIKAASIGVAMGRSGTDVTREAADMVLYDDNYNTIVHAIEEGRVIFSNIKRFILFLFTINAGLVLAVFIAAILGWPPILTPTQILWINLITNGLPALALGMEPVHLDPMRGRPRDPEENLITRRELIWLLGYGSVMAALGLGVFNAHYSPFESPTLLSHAQTQTFTVLAISPLFHALNARSRRRSLFVVGILSNARLWGAFAAAFALQAAAIYVPVLSRVFGTTRLTGSEVLVALGCSCIVWVAGELQKAASIVVKKLVAPTSPT